MCAARSSASALVMPLAFSAAVSVSSAFSMTASFPPLIKMMRPTIAATATPPKMYTVLLVFLMGRASSRLPASDIVVFKVAPSAQLDNLGPAYCDENGKDQEARRQRRW